MECRGKRCGILCFKTIMRYFIYLSYDGTNYHGWQEQPNATSVQQTLNEALSTILRQTIETTGAGRTDTGVNAKMMVAHFDVDQQLEQNQLVDKLNRLLPPDIAIQSIKQVPDDAHARFDAKQRTYHYDIVLHKDPFRQHFATRVYTQLDFKKMNEAAQMLLGTQDFTSFSKTGTDTKTNICTITHACWTEIEPDYWRFEISADRFLRNMVRAIVGTLIQVGKGKINPNDLRNIIERKDRCAAGESVPAKGLSLADIQY